MVFMSCKVILNQKENTIINSLIIEKRNKKIPLTGSEINLIIKTTENDGFFARFFALFGITQFYRYCTGNNTVYRGYLEYWTGNFNRHVEQQDDLCEVDKRTGRLVSRNDYIPSKWYDDEALCTNFNNLLFKTRQINQKFLVEDVASKGKVGNNVASVISSFLKIPTLADADKAFAEAGLRSFEARITDY